jgi:CheY-like chemotaxis protein
MTAQNAPIPSPQEDYSGRFILVIDDEPVIRTIARTCLMKVGLVVAEAGDEQEAFEAIHRAEKPIDLILLDLSLGEKNGVELIPAFRRQCPKTRILVVSGMGSDEVEGVDADGYLAKPFTKSSLLTAVKHALGGSSA